MTLARNDVRGKDSCAMKNAKQNATWSRPEMRTAILKQAKEKSGVSAKLGSDY